jgi:hypothetical protein
VVIVVGDNSLGSKLEVKDTSKHDSSKRWLEKFKESVETVGYLKDG